MSRPTVYGVAPRSRTQDAAYVDQLLAILPFEPASTPASVAPTTYVGHP